MSPLKVNIISYLRLFCILSHFHSKNGLINIRIENLLDESLLFHQYRLVIDPKTLIAINSLHVFPLISHFTFLCLHQIFFNICTLAINRSYIHKVIFFITYFLDSHTSHLMLNRALVETFGAIKLYINIIYVVIAHSFKLLELNH